MATPTRDSDLSKITPPTLIAVILDEAVPWGQLDKVMQASTTIEEQTAR
jgi:hypothetical protein